MTKVINLQQKRKAKARTEKEKKAAENRRKFGQTKTEKQLKKLRAERAEKNLQGHKLETEDEEKIKTKPAVQTWKLYI